MALLVPFITEVLDCFFANPFFSVYFSYIIAVGLCDMSPGSHEDYHRFITCEPASYSYPKWYLHRKWKLVAETRVEHDKCALVGSAFKILCFHIVSTLNVPLLTLLKRLMKFWMLDVCLQTGNIKSNAHIFRGVGIKRNYGSRVNI